MMVLINRAVVTGLFLSAITPAYGAIVRITPLGDSLTGGPGCWRALLWQRLQNAGITNTDFVGTQPSGGCGFTFDGEHEGHGGFKATGIVTDNQLPGWLSVSKPDVVMMQLGTNDVWSSIPAATIISAFSTLVDQMRASKPTMRILVAQIPPMNPGGCTACDWPGQVVTLNAAIAAWAPGKSTAASPITVVDCWTGFVQPTDFTDGVHVTDSGTQKLANCWYEPVKAAILAAGGTSPATSTAAQTTRPTTSQSFTTSVRTTTAVVSTTTRAVTSSSTPGGAPLYGQCGGTGWSGPTTCASGTCTFSNAWYSQCLP